MLQRLFKRCIQPFFQTILLSLLCSTLYASELLPLANDLKPNENGLPPPLEKPLNISVCFFDMQGKNGDFYQDCRKTSPLQGEDVRQWHESPPPQGACLVPLTESGLERLFAKKEN